LEFVLGPRFLPLYFPEKMIKVNGTKKSPRKGEHMADTILWRGNWEEALEEAKKAGQPLLLELYLEGCPHCQRLDRETHADKTVAQTVTERFIPVRLEGRGHMDLVKKLGVTGAPTTLIFSPEGKELRRFAGFLAPPEYLQEIQGAG
jgi:uncharacterized protein YyaL (SSP411 family)